MTTLTQLQDILDRMTIEVQNRHAEVAHGHADDLLIEALRTAADPITRPVVEDIIAAYERVSKWYAQAVLAPSDH